eukprot:CAMPEP_0182877298 /NCGR_PEP_ID=MMETSP0034_2-20130328/14669_1 /TAXON_ID=156128 /ORGANISM="Nephroselmis pyriformis, Strain CCMP717" /LENGTH=68 /DNA_ID=CAMNT_0025010131 /DNA_START=52 /DNA_END=254 /DNA_ORIENTATION=+
MGTHRSLEYARIICWLTSTTTLTLPKEYICIPSCMRPTRGRNSTPLSSANLSTAALRVISPSSCGSGG